MKKYLAILFLFPLISYGALTDGLEGYWTLDETSGTRVDSTANNNDLTDNNTVLYGTGIISNGGDFEAGNSEYLSVLDVTQTGLDITGDISVSGWFKVESLASDDYEILVGKWGGGTGSSFLFSYKDSSGTKKLEAGFYQAGDCTSNISVSVNTDLGTDVWHYVTYTFNNTSNIVTFYVDGTSVGTGNPSVTTICDSSAAFTIGDLGLGVGGFYDGLADEVGIWNRVLTADEITSLYNGGLGLAYPLTVDSGDEGTSTATSTSISVNVNGIIIALGFLVFLITVYLMFFFFKDRI